MNALIESRAIQSRQETAKPTFPSTLLGAHLFLKGMREAHLGVLENWAMEVNFQPGEVIFKQGDPANRFYLIYEGKVALESRSPTKVTSIQTIGADEVLGWSWLFPPYRWHFDARAVEYTRAVFFYATPLREECETDHEFGYELLKRTSQIMLERLQACRRPRIGGCGCLCKKS